MRFCIEKSCKRFENNQGKIEFVIKVQLYNRLLFLDIICLKYSLRNSKRYFIILVGLLAFLQYIVYIINIICSSMKWDCCFYYDDSFVKIIYAVCTGFC